MLEISKIDKSELSEVIIQILGSDKYESVTIQGFEKYSESPDLSDMLRVNFFPKKYNESPYKIPISILIRLSDLREIRINKILG